MRDMDADELANYLAMTGVPNALIEEINREGNTGADWVWLIRNSLSTLEDGMKNDKLRMARIIRESLQGDDDEQEKNRLAASRRQEIVDKARNAEVKIKERVGGVEEHSDDSDQERNERERAQRTRIDVCPEVPDFDNEEIRGEDLHKERVGGLLASHGCLGWHARP